ncbi:hypothetical protein GCG21_14325 [Pseudactinotalea sp. HY160]|uniref:hypothetical protein n=1 Tax=Pseudactinotalea sp. HY160 TaxID=2654490 RepID=UPI00128C4A5F|nr:hypothetical protein [Pseudactinotalea sp. HY160]MPV51158.1 hypothetical protein [Pseudactinotalea sp. HY160]
MTATRPRRAALAGAGACAVLLAGSVPTAAAPGDPLPDGQRITALTQIVIDTEGDELEPADAVTRLFDLDSVTAASVAAGGPITGWSSGGWVIGGGLDVDEDGQGYAVLQSAPVDAPDDLLTTQMLAAGPDEPPTGDPETDLYRAPAVVPVDATDGTFGTPIAIVYDSALGDRDGLRLEGCLGADYTGGLLRAICIGYGTLDDGADVVEIGVIDPVTGEFTPETRVANHLGYDYTWVQDLSTSPTGEMQLLFVALEEDGQVESISHRLAPVDLGADEVATSGHREILQGDEDSMFAIEAIDFDAAGQLWALGSTVAGEVEVHTALGTIDPATGAMELVDDVSGPADRPGDSFLGVSVWGAEPTDPDPTETADPDPTETSDPDPTETTDPTEPDPAETTEPDPTTDPAETTEPDPTTDPAESSDPDPTAATPDEELARTGSEPALPVALALAAILGGGAILAAVRRRARAN